MYHFFLKFIFSSHLLWVSPSRLQLGLSVSDLSSQKLIRLWCSCTLIPMVSGPDISVAAITLWFSTLLPPTLIALKFHTLYNVQKVIRSSKTFIYTSFDKTGDLWILIFGQKKQNKLYIKTFAFVHWIILYRRKRKKKIHQKKL